MQGGNIEIILFCVRLPPLIRLTLKRFLNKNTINLYITALSPY